MPKNNLDARIRQWEIDNNDKRNKSQVHKPGSQKK
jgi:hypothetical protein